MNDDEMGPRFPAVSDAYDEELQDIIVKCGEELGLKVEDSLPNSETFPTFSSSTFLVVLLNLQLVAYFLNQHFINMLTLPDESADKITLFSSVARLLLYLLTGPVTYLYIHLGFIYFLSTYLVLALQSPLLSSQPPLVHCLIRNTFLIPS